MNFDGFVDALYAHGWRGTADAQHTRIQQMWAQIEAERECLTDALEWYAAQAREIRINVQLGATGAMMERMQELAVDGGKRARDAINGRRATCQAK